jgi:hypothetical protein
LAAWRSHNDASSEQERAMKLPLAAVTLAIAGLSASPLDAPATKLEPLSTGRSVLMMPPLELNPHAVYSQPVLFSTLRESASSAFGSRLNHLDDRVSDLKARADLTALRSSLDPEFERLKSLRANVANALLNLRNPTIGLDAAEYAALTALNELEVAIEALGGRFEELEHLEPLRVS